MDVSKLTPVGKDESSAVQPRGARNRNTDYFLFVSCAHDVVDFGV